MAKWSAAYQKRLPDSAFLFVDPLTGERKLPVFNAQGCLSAAHLANAKARLNQTKLPPGQRALIRRKIRSLEVAVGKRSRCR